MTTNEIMNNEEVIEATAENIVEESSNKNLKLATGVGCGILVGLLAYKYIAKPVGTKIKDKIMNRKTKLEANEEDEPIEGDAVEVEAN